MATMGSCWRLNMACGLSEKRQGPRHLRRARPLRGVQTRHSGHPVELGHGELDGHAHAVVDVSLLGMVSTLFVIQYSTSPDGKKKNMTENTSGMIHISFGLHGVGRQQG